jgi:ABC-2 type transport system ATP-binding protein
VSIDKGEFVFFIGPSGSGKSTIIKLLLHEITPSKGKVIVNTKDVTAMRSWRIPAFRRSIGCVFQDFRLLPNRTAYENVAFALEVIGKSKAVARRVVPEVLELVGLRDRAKDRVKTYSLGMKQRLAVASALLKEPRLLILDEPANGLDPGGIREMRTLMRNLAQSGMTVVLSSHILGEIQLICDSVTIISAGRRVAAGSVADVLARHRSTAVRVGVEPGVELLDVAELLRAAGAPQVTLDGDHILVGGVDRPAWITWVLSQRGVWVSELSRVEADLESVFLELTGTAPVDGRNRQVDQTAVPAPPSGGGWGQ